VKLRVAALAAGCVALAVACESGKGPSGVHIEKPASAAQADKAQPVEVARNAAHPAEPSTAPAPTAEAPGANAVAWHGNIEWHEWTDALAIAKRESKPIMVVVYADWCPHCRALGPVFADPDIEAMAKRLVMVRQNHDENPAWLEPYNQKYGAYVPRIFFFDSSGKMRDDLTSGHPRYPYFYAAEQPEFLKQTMRRAIGS
jgi:thiol-disulfide isomerase/thioredoxin